MKLNRKVIPLFNKKRDLKEKLDDPSGENTQGKCHHRSFKKLIKEEDGKDDGDVEKDREQWPVQRNACESSGFPCRGQKAP